MLGWRATSGEKQAKPTPPKFPDAASAGEGALVAVSTWAASKLTRLWSYFLKAWDSDGRDITLQEEGGAIYELCGGTRIRTLSWIGVSSTTLQCRDRGRKMQVIPFGQELQLESVCSWWCSVHDAETAESVGLRLECLCKYARAGVGYSGIEVPGC
jgi:hypothetical protein